MAQLLCLGDSITDCGKIFGNPPLGNGYVNLLSQKLRESSQDWHISNHGVDGFSVARLLEYVCRNLGNIPGFSDGTVTVLIGINDIGLMMNTARSPAQQAQMMVDFLRNYQRLLALLTERTSHVILMEPFIFPAPARYSLWFPHVKTMSQGIKKLATQFHLPYLFLHEPLNREAHTYGMDKITVDGIHLTTQGHEYIACELFSLLRSEG